MNYIVFPFGKFKGVRLEDIDSNYLIYAVETFALPDELKISITLILGKRLNLFSQKIQTAETRRRIDSIYIQLRNKYHPESEGSDVEMMVVNECFDMIKECL